MRAFSLINSVSSALFLLVCYCFHSSLAWQIFLINLPTPLSLTAASESIAALLNKRSIWFICILMKPDSPDFTWRLLICNYRAHRNSSSKRGRNWYPFRRRDHLRVVRAEVVTGRAKPTKVVVSITGVVASRHRIEVRIGKVRSARVRLPRFVFELCVCKHTRLWLHNSASSMVIMRCRALRRTELNFEPRFNPW